MYKFKLLLFLSFAFVFGSFACGVDQADAKNDKQSNDNIMDEALKHHGKVTPSEQKAAAATFQQLYQSSLSANALAPAAPDPGGVPHYFGPYPNWANSPMPTGSVGSVTLIDPGSGYTGPTVEIRDLYDTTGATGATASATVDTDQNSLTYGQITGITLTAVGSGYTAPVVIISDPTGAGAGAAATAALDPATLTGGIRKFVDALPGMTPAAANLLGQYIPVAVPDSTTYPAGGSGYTSAPTVTITDATGTGAEALALIDPDTGKVINVSVTNHGSNYSANPLVVFSGGGATSQAVGIAQVDPVAKTVTGVTLTGADYYEIAVVEFQERMHTDLPPTRVRGYVQISTDVVPGAKVSLTNPGGSPILLPDGSPAYAVDNPHYMGPIIQSRRNVPVRVKFYNLLPTGTGGNLFIPVDKTAMGAGTGPLGGTENYTENRIVSHLHGNNGVWISDGTPNQWITPAGENTSYPQGVSAVDVPDMQTAGDRDGVTTLYYTNAQSARLEFYHDHALAITRLNVYAGMAAPYLITDQVEDDLINGTNNSGVNPGNLHVLPGIGIPLVIQDKGFVDAKTIAYQDPTWNSGTTAPVPNTGDLWYPHVYMPAQNPWDPSGINAFGRWHYAAWFWPPATNLMHPPVANEYYDPINAPWEPPQRPDTPNPSMVGEAFMDTSVVNGTAYPYIEVEPKAYRFRILSIANDRFFNLQLYEADPSVTTADGRTNTEVKMIPSAGVPGLPADWPSGVPDPATKGPDWVQIGTEGGFMPHPVVIPSQPVTWNMDQTAFNFGNVDQHSLLLGPAERADVLVDFSQYAGKTLILYNDAPAAFPAYDSHYDYFTGNPDNTDIGGAPTTQPGFGPNTRTIMQIRVGTAITTPTADVSLANLQTVFAKTAAKRGVFEASQDPIIMPQADYNSAYGVSNFPSGPTTAYVQLHDFQKNFQPIDSFGNLLGPVTLPLEPKAIQDEMGEAYDNEYGRMSGMLGLELPVTAAGTQQFMLYPFMSPPVDLIKGSVYGEPMGSLNDGTQIWKITHNGVDTHVIHTHLFNVQLVNRVAWDGALIPPDPNELGWKESFRVNPLEHTIVALKPLLPNAPWQVPNSIRMIDPTKPEGVELMGPPTGFMDPLGNPVTILNHPVNYGYEYMEHCHLLAHEEMDMMHAISISGPPEPPTNLAFTIKGSKATLTWTDNSLNETGFIVQKATAAGGPWTTVATLPEVAGMGTTVTFQDPNNLKNKTTYYYQVMATNVVGDIGTPGFPTITSDSAFSSISFTK